MFMNIHSSNKISPEKVIKGFSKMRTVNLQLKYAYIKNQKCI